MLDFSAHRHSTSFNTIPISYAPLTPPKEDMNGQLWYVYERSSLECVAITTLALQLALPLFLALSPFIPDLPHFHPLFICIGATGLGFPLILELPASAVWVTFESTLVAWMLGKIQALRPSPPQFRHNPPVGGHPDDSFFAPYMYNIVYSMGLIRCAIMRIVKTIVSLLGPNAPTLPSDLSSQRQLTFSVLRCRGRLADPVLGQQRILDHRISCLSIGCASPPHAHCSSWPA